MQISLHRDAFARMNPAKTLQFLHSSPAMEGDFAGTQVPVLDPFVFHPANRLLPAFLLS